MYPNDKNVLTYETLELMPNSKTKGIHKLFTRMIEFMNLTIGPYV